MLNNNILTLLKNSVAAWGPRQVVVAAGRNMEIEENLGNTGSQIVSWGSSLYEWAYGRFACDKPFDLRLNPEYRLRFPFIQPSEDTIDDIALLVLAQELRNAFHDEAYAELMKRQWVELIARARTYVRNRPLHLYDYWGPDGKHGSVSKMLMPPAYVFIPQQVNVAAEEAFVSKDWKVAFSHEGFDKTALTATTLAYPFFFLSPNADPAFEDRLIGRLMVGDQSKWVYSSHGTPVVLREEAPKISAIPLFNPDTGHKWMAEIADVSKGGYAENFKRCMGVPMPEKVFGAGKCFLLLVDGQLLGGWRIRLAPLTSAVVEVGQTFAMTSACLDMVDAAAHSLDARLLYESHYKTRIKSVKQNMELHEYPKKPLELHYYLEDWRAEHY